MTPETDISLHLPTIKSIASTSFFTIELGPAKGDGSTVAILEGMQELSAKSSLFISVDRADYMEQKPKVPYWHLVIGDTRERSTVKKVQELSKERVADLIFIDTHHTYEQMSKELEVWSSLAGPDTYWLFHDTWMMGEYNPMTDAIKEYAKKYHLIYEDISEESHGLGVMHAS